MTKRLFIFAIFILALVERVWFDFGPNIELVTIASLLAAFYMDKKMALLLTFGLVVLTDIVIGNSNIFIFTWSGFILPIFAIEAFKKLKMNKVFSGLLAGLSFNIIFYLWTNFGVWALDSWGMYPNSMLGLMQSLVNGIPFLKYQLTSTLFFVPIGFIIFEILFNKFFITRKNNLFLNNKLFN